MLFLAYCIHKYLFTLFQARANSCLIHMHNEPSVLYDNYDFHNHPNRGEQGYARQGHQWRRYAVPVTTLPSLPGERRRSGSLLLVFETVIVAALRNKADRFVQLDSSANTYTVAVVEMQCNCG